MPPRNAALKFIDHLAGSIRAHRLAGTNRRNQTNGHQAG
jgi:hypothetical protein